MDFTFVNGREWQTLTVALFLAMVFMTTAHVQNAFKDFLQPLSLRQVTIHERNQMKLQVFLKTENS
jgi:hypothetical protein